MTNIILLGFDQATITNDILNLIKETGQLVSVVPPEIFLNSVGNTSAQYIITVTKDVTLRKQLADKLDSENLQRATFIHKTAVVDPSATVCSGTVLYPFTTVLYKTKIGKDCTVSPYSMIAHRSVVGNGSMIMPGTLIAGSTIIGNYCTFGLKSGVIDKITITNDVVVGAGSLITKNIEVSGMYVGSPARKIK